MAVFGLTTVSAQKTVVAKKNQKVFDIVEQMPEYPGGQAALIEYLSKNIKYPADAEKKKVEGKVFVTFVVDSDGKITDVSLLRKVFPSLDAEAMRVISAMPNWIPGRQKGQAVRVKYTVPIMFRLK
jgi:protein TonB